MPEMLSVSDSIFGSAKLGYIDIFYWLLLANPNKKSEEYEGTL